MYRIAMMSLCNGSRMWLHRIAILASLRNGLRRLFLIFLLILALSTSQLALRLRTFCISFLGFRRTG